MTDALLPSRLQFALTVGFHYVFVQLTLGLVLVVFLFETRALMTGRREYGRAARFWAKIFGVNFGMGVVTGIPLEFQFGTNWSELSRITGGVIGQTLGMEGVFSFFLESSFLGLFLYGGRRLGARGRWVVSLLMLIGSWLSAFFIVATNAWMQHPVGHRVDGQGVVHLESLAALLTNPWLGWQYPHTVLGAVVTGSFVVAATGALYTLERRGDVFGRLFLRTGVVVGLVAALLCAFPTGDSQAQMVQRHQPITFAAMEGHFHTRSAAPLVLIGQPDMEEKTLDNPIEVPSFLSVLTHKRWDAEVRGLTDFAEEDWPDDVPLVYYGYHIMVGLGTMFILVMALAAWRLLRGRLESSPGMLWTLLLAWPFPFVANTAGWLTAETGRQPWVVHGLLRTRDAVSPMLSSGNTLFTLLGFAGLYVLLGILYVIMAGREILHGPASEEP